MQKINETERRKFDLNESLSISKIENGYDYILKTNVPSKMLNQSEFNTFYNSIFAKDIIQALFEYFDVI